MLRTSIFCMTLLVASAVVAADDAAADTAKAETGSPPAKVTAGDVKAQAGARKAESKAEGAEGAKAGGEVKTVSGMSILGNDEAPKSLVIVPWKGSQIGDMPGIPRLLDDSTQPVDKEVFMRELAYYEIRSN